MVYARSNHRKRTAALLIILAFLAQATSALAEDCERCGKRLKWGSGTCAKCKMEMLHEATKPVVDAATEFGVRQMEKSAQATTDRVVGNLEATQKDGTAHQFHPQGNVRYRGSDRRRVLFVNGMRTDFREFQRTTQRLADIIGRPVTGIYSGGITRGVASSIGLQIDNWSRGTGYAQSLPDGQSLIRELDRSALEDRDVILVCYSRGTMLSEAIVKNHHWARSHTTIYAFGCAVSGVFPVREYYKIVNRDDHLMCDRMVDRRNLVWGKSGSHDLMDYLDNLENGGFDTALPLMDGITR